ncbi:MAG: hypothetical protein CM15mP103_08970 [Gammaproteobacteria bacterium]|nr:MAG: hypothetical protein CM15mP103_08970 [Gammaproteobacteria bacterium]
MRRAIAVVPQDCVLFNDSLRENIRYGRPSATDEEVAQAIEAAYLGDVIERLPDGLDSVVGSAASNSRAASANGYRSPGRC